MRPFSLRDLGYLVGLGLLAAIVLRELQPQPYAYPLIAYLIGVPILLRFDQRRSGNDQ